MDSAVAMVDVFSVVDSTHSPAYHVPDAMYWMPSMPNQLFDAMHWMADMVQSVSDIVHWVSGAANPYLELLATAKSSTDTFSVPCAPDTVRNSGNCDTRPSRIKHIQKLEALTRCASYSHRTVPPTGKSQ